MCFLMYVRMYVHTYVRSCGVFDVILSETDVVLLLFMCITLYVCMCIRMYICVYVCTYVCIGSETAGGGVG